MTFDSTATTEIYALECRRVSKSFDDCRAVREVSLDVPAGQIVALLGPSGCGKTTLLRLIAGFEVPDSGTILIADRPVASSAQFTPPEARRVGMVFQEYALFPHLTVSQNVAFGLRLSTAEKHTRVEEMLVLVGLDSLGNRMPHELSGGQQQRVALARALAPRPELLLLDEPFSNLDAALRRQMRAEVRAILKRAGTSCVFVTHDQEEALSLADQVAVMVEGSIVQMAAPAKLYQSPATKLVAAFVGEANFLHGEAFGGIVRCALGELPVSNPASGLVEVLIRPETIQLEREITSPTTPTAHILWHEFYGPDQRIGIALEDGTALIARISTRQEFTIGERVGIYIVTPTVVFPKG